MAFQDLTFLGFVAILFVLSTLPLKKYKIILFALANLLFLYSYGSDQLIYALFLTICVFILGLLKKQSFLLDCGIIAIVLVMVLQRLPFEGVSSLFGLMAFSYSGLKAIYYLRECKKTKFNVNYLNLFTYLFYFPSFLQGPILSYKEFMNGIRADKGFDYNIRKVGFMQTIYGYTLRLVIATPLYTLCMQVINDPLSYYQYQRLLAFLLYVVVLYLDWDAYSNIAVGISKLMGVPINENFNAPLISVDAQDFWRRWHISLSTFLKDCVYIPLGGSRCSKFRSFINSLITFIICGLWHGLSGVYLLWGAINGVAVGTMRIVKGLKNQFLTIVYGQFSKLLVYISLTLFAFSSIGSWISYIGTIFSSTTNEIIPWMTSNQTVVYCVGLIIIWAFDILRYFKNGFEVLAKIPLVLRIALYCVFIGLIMIFGQYGPGYDAANFIYQIF